MTTPFTPVSSGDRLSDQVAQQLRAQIVERRLAPGAKLPTEAQLALQFGVSRTVVREAVSRLKSLRLVQPRQGSGVYVAERPAFEPLDFPPLDLHTGQAASKAALLHMLELRRALEAETAARAAQRRNQADLRRIAQSLKALDRAVREGHDGVEQDLQFHRSLALAAHNPFLLRALDFMAQYMRGAIGVTRANEARTAALSQQVRQEHGDLLQAIADADPAAAQRAATAHLDNARGRIEQAGAAFWQGEGSRLARALVDGETGAR